MTNYITKYGFVLKEALTPTESLVLECFDNCDRRASRAEIQQTVWPGYEGSRVVDVYIGYLRKKLVGYRITFIRGWGYRIERDL